MRHAPDEIVMHLELLDMGFDVNPWVKKRSFYPREELANCADDRAFLPMILFRTSVHVEIFSLFDNFDFR
ncbi:MAG: hypothetical protein E6294_05755 [Klebsiella sp.]|nr:hypothetical protein [Klebsiella sp.]